MATKIAKLQPQAGTVHWLNECIERGKTETFSEVTTLTPGLAGELLRRNPDNRGIRPIKAGQFASDIRGGRWVFNGEPIIISREGLLNDGQHRAHAVVEANQSIDTVIVFGIDRHTRTTVDQGSARTAGDYMAMDGVQNANVQASIARQLVAYERADGKSVSGAGNVTNAEVVTRAASDETVARAAHFAASRAKQTKPFAAPAIMGLAYYLFAEINKVEADQYMTQVCAGEGLARKDPAYTVRERLLTMGYSRNDKLHVIFRGWNAFRQNRQIDHTKIIGPNLPALI